MDAAKIFLTVVGIIYLGFAVWCTAKPVETAAALGLKLDPGSGQSEYVTVYGGFQLALAILFLYPWLDASVLSCSLFTCLVMHGCLVLMRTVGFFLFTGIRPMTMGFAASEWVVFLIAGMLWWWKRAI